jgi:hypothetical protein
MCATPSSTRRALTKHAAAERERSPAASNRRIAPAEARSASAVVRAAGAAPPRRLRRPRRRGCVWFPQLSRCRSRRSASDFVRFFRTSSSRQPSRTCRPRRSHANDVNPQQPRHVHKPPAHKGVTQQRARSASPGCRRPYSTFRCIGRCVRANRLARSPRRPASTYSPSSN